MPPDENSSKCGWVKLFHPSGALVTLPLDTIPSVYTNVFNNVGAALAAGFTVAAPGLEAGERIEQAGFVVRREKENEDKSLTPVIDIYPAHEATKFPFLTVYLNTDDDVRNFERATGFSLPALKVYEGENRIERGKATKSDAYVAKAPKPFGVVLIPNPKFNEADRDAALKANKMYAVPARKFVRWESQTSGPAPASTDPTTERGPNGEQPVGTKVDKSPNEDKPNKKLVEEWKGKMMLKPELQILNALCQRYLAAIDCKYTKRAVWVVVKEYGEGRGWLFNGDRKEWYAEQDKADDRVIPF